MAGDLTYKATLQDEISPALRKIQNEIKSTQDIFNKFSSVLSGLAIGAFITNAVKMAAALDDVASASGMALETVIGFGKAVSANGGSVEGANQAIGRFANFITRAAEGNREAQETFQKLGISLNDLATLSEEDLMRKTVEGLAKTNDNALRSAKGMEIFGKSFNSVDFKGVNGDLGRYIEKSKEQASATKAAAEAEQKLSNAYKELQLQLLKVLEPINKFLGELEPGTIEKFVAAVVKLVEIIGVAALAFGAFKLAQGPLASLGGQMAAVVFEGITLRETLGTLTSKMGGGLKGIGDDLGRMKSAITGVYDGAKVALGPFEKLILAGSSFISVLSRLAGVIGIIYAVYEAIKLIFDIFKDTAPIKWLDEMGAKMAGILGFSYKTEEAKRAEAKAAAKAAEETSNQTAAAANLRDVIAAGAENYAKMVVELEKGMRAYQDSNQQILDRLRLEGELIGLTENQKAVRQALFDVESKNQAELTRLQELYNEKSKSQKKEDQDILPKIVELQNKVKESLQGQKDQVEELIRSNQLRLEQEKQLQAITEFALKSQIDNAKTVRDLQAEMVRSTMSETERKYFDIARAAEESARSAIAAENSRRRSLGLAAMTADEEQKYFEAAKKGLEGVRQQIDAGYRQSRTFASGWQKAWKDYADSATNAAKTAENIFNKTTQGIEDAIVGLVKTGKFEWKSMLSGIAEEFLRSGIRKSITGLFEGLGSGTDSLLGSIGKMFGLDGLFGGSGGAGKGQSSNNPLYVYDVGGGGYGGYANNSMISGGGFGGGQSSGGGWWDSVTGAVSGVVDTVGGWFGDIADTVGGWFGGGGGSGGSWLDDIVSGVGSLFGGWFANGGTLGAGKWGIAGENGPELISGPAQVTPMMGSQNVTYNINAVDAASFKAMIAADPSFIHAVAQQGGRGIARRY